MYVIDPMQTKLRLKTKIQKETVRDFKDNERSEDITKNNQHLLKHLLEIGQGKAVSKLYI